MKVYSKRSTPSRQQQQTKPSQKRALPPRHSFLTEAVQNALEKQSSKVSLTFIIIIIIINKKRSILFHKNKIK